MSFRGRDLTGAIVTLIASEFAAYTRGPALAAALEDGAVGWAGTPGASSFTPYVLVEPVTGGYFEGTIGSPYDSGRPDYIIRPVGVSVEQCEVVADAVHALLTTTKPVVAGQSVELVSPDVQGGVEADNDVTPAIYHSPSRWRFFLTPA